MLSDADFIAALSESQQYVEQVAGWLRRNGYEVDVPALRIRPDRAQRFEYSDDGDLFVKERVEVKHRPDLKFTGLHDFPFPTVVVDAAHRIEKARPLPMAWVILNATGSAAIIVHRTSRKHWQRVELYNRKDAERKPYYTCPLQHCQFVTFGGKREQA